MVELGVVVRWCAPSGLPLDELLRTVSAFAGAFKNSLQQHRDAERRKERAANAARAKKGGAGGVGKEI